MSLSFAGYASPFLPSGDFQANNRLSTRILFKDPVEGEVVGKPDLDFTLASDWWELLQAMEDMAQSSERTLEETTRPFLDSGLVVSLWKEGERRPFGLRFAFRTPSGDPDADHSEAEASFSLEEWTALRADWEAELSPFPVRGHHVTRRYVPPEKRFSVPPENKWNPSTVNLSAAISGFLIGGWLMFGPIWRLDVAVGIGAAELVLLWILLRRFLNRLKAENGNLVRQFLLSSEDSVIEEVRTEGFELGLGFGLCFREEGLLIEGDLSEYPYSDLRLQVFPNRRLPLRRLGFVLDVELLSSSNVADEGSVLECAWSPELARFLESRGIIPESWNLIRKGLETGNH